MPGAKDTMVSNIDTVPRETSRNAQCYFIHLSLQFTSVDAAAELEKLNDNWFLIWGENLACLFGLLNIEHKKGKFSNQSLK